MNDLPVLIVLLGPTGVGKTEISLKMAQYFGCSIISSDSRQLYRELQIGTAAPTPAQLNRVRHYFIGSHSVFDDYSAGQFENDVLALLESLFAEQNILMMVGGSMMYIDAVCNGLDDIPTIDADTRQFWQEQYSQNGLEYLQCELKRLDPEHYNQVDLKNYKRVIHALEVCSLTGKTFSELRTGRKKDRPFNIIKIGLNRPRIELYERINVRVDEMIRDGLLDEARQFYEYRHLNPLNTVGYKELYEYMDGKWTLDFAIQMIKQDTRHYAKRQLTWFNRDKDIHWFHPDEQERILGFIQQEIDDLK